MRIENIELKFFGKKKNVCYCDCKKKQKKSNQSQIDKTQIRSKKKTAKHFEKI